MNRKSVPPRLLAGGAQRFLTAIAFVCVATAFPAAAQTVTTLSTQYTAPKFVAVDANKTVWVTDASHPLSALPFVNGAYGTPTAFGGSTPEFTSPAGVVVDPGGTVHVGNNPAAGQVGFWEALPPNYTSINGLACSCSGTPGGAAIDSHGNFFLADSAAALLEITAPGYNGLVTLSAGTHPAAVAFDAQDNLFVTDQLSGSGQILKLTASSGYAQTVSITSANLQRPVGIAVDSHGNLYVTDSTANTLTELLAPDYATAVVIDSTHFNAPMGIAIDAQDNIFIAATGNNALKLIPAQPAVTGLTPAAGRTAGGNTVTISGAHLTGATAVSFGGNAAVSFTVVSDTQVTATVPAGSPGTIDVRVTTPNGTSVAAPADRYAYTPAPTVTGISPASGTTLGGTSVTITGANLAGASAVTIGGAVCTAISGVTATSLSCMTSAGSAGAASVLVTTPGGTNAANTLYTYIPPAPTVTAISPTSGTTLGGTGVTITGTNLAGASAVTIGGAVCTAISGVTATSLSCMTSAGSAGAASVLVTTPGGTNAANTLYTYIPPAPTITAISPTSGTTLGGTSVTITGTNLTGVTAVKFGTSNATSFTVNSNTQITATSPAGSAGIVDVTVSNVGATSATNAADGFTYVALTTPTVTGVLPSGGPVSGGTLVTLTGTNLSGATAVMFGAVSATFVIDSATQIRATAPAGAAATVDITVTTSGGTSATGAADRFTYGVATTAVVVDPTSSVIIYAGLDGAGVYKSANGGTSWTAATSQPANNRIRALLIDKNDGAKLYAATFGGGAFKSVNAGVDWSACGTASLTNLNLLSLAMDAGGKLYAGSEAGVFVSADGCASWSALNNGLP